MLDIRFSAGPTLELLKAEGIELEINQWPADFLTIV